MITLGLLMSFAQLCSPAPIERMSLCSIGMAQCYIDLANPNLIEDENALEVCSEQILPELYPN